MTMLFFRKPAWIAFMICIGIVIIVFVVASHMGFNGYLPTDGSPRSKSFGLEEKRVSDIVALVNGTAITRADVEMEMKSVEGRLFTNGMPSSDTEIVKLRKQVLEWLINRELICQAGQKEGIAVDDNEISKAMENIRNRFPGATEFQDFLKKVDITEEQLRAQFWKGFMVARYAEPHFADKSRISEQDIRKYYEKNRNQFKTPEQVRARHILIKIEPPGEQDQRKAARSTIDIIRKRLGRGEHFSELAEGYSQCPSRVRGGDLGYVTRGQLPEAFEKAAFAMRPGQTSPPVETPYGYHLIRVEERKQETTRPYAETKEEIGRYLKSEKVESEMSRFVEGLRQKANIEIFMMEPAGG